MLPRAYQVTADGYEYLANDEALQAVKDTLVYWYDCAQDIVNNVAGPQGQAWLQLQTADILFFNCGGIHTDNKGDYGRDYVVDGLYQKLKGKIVVNAALTFVEAGDYEQGVGPWDRKNRRYKFLQECHTFTCSVGSITYSSQNPPLWADLVRDDKGKPVQLTGGKTYQVVANFHLYVGAPFENSIATSSTGAYTASLMDFAVYKKKK